MAAAPFGPLVQHLRHLVAVQCPWNDGQLLERFSVRCDELAFTALVARHGPMVLRVCRNVLKHEQDAEDAFQASFLVLARNTKSIRKPAALAEWLHGVAYRTAMKAKRSAARRRHHESRKGAMPPKPNPSPGWNDIQAVLDEEIQRLALPYRAAFVLCVLEGKTGPEAAAALGVAEGTVSSRLTRARQHLQKRLERRGIQLGSVLAALSASATALQAGVPAQLANATIRSGIALASGVTTAGMVSSHIAALAAGVTRAMLLTKIKIASAILLVASVCGGASVLTSQALVATEDDGLRVTEAQKTAKSPAKSTQMPAPAAKAAPKSPIAVEEDAATTVRYRGRVIGPDGRPVEGAKLYCENRWSAAGKLIKSTVQVTTGPDGKFDFSIANAKSGEYASCIAAVAPNLGAGWVNTLKIGATDDLTIRLVADDAPITGQIIDLEGKGVPNATLSVQRISAAPNEDLEPWLKAVNDGSPPSPNRANDLRYAHLPSSTDVLSPTATTDSDGRFRLNGLGRNRAVDVQLDGPTIARKTLHIVTAAIEKIDIPTYQADADGDRKTFTTYYGANFRYAAEPTRPIIGVVRDKDTQKPLVGMRIESHAREITSSYFAGLSPIVDATTDAEGRYRLTGMPQGAGYWIIATPPEDLPYVAEIRKVPDDAGAGPATVNIDLKRGVWVEGKVTDSMTGKPLRRMVQYYSMYTNPILEIDYPGFSRGAFFAFRHSAKDGSYRIPGLPGPGLIAIRTVWAENYLPVQARDDEFGTQATSLNTAPFAIFLDHGYDAIARIDPAKGVDSVRRDVTLDPAWSFTGTLIGPDGAPVNNARGFFLNGRHAQNPMTPLKEAGFKVGSFNPRAPRTILFQHLEKGLVGIAQSPKADGGSIVVKLYPGPNVTARLIDDAANPRADVELKMSFTRIGTSLWRDYAPDRIRTNKDGRFRLEALLPGCEFRLADGKGVLRISGDLPAGQTKDLGDLRTEAEKQ